MTDLLIADPPHDPRDLTRAAELLGLAVAEVWLKVNYGVPEIWFADASTARVDEAVEVLREAGLRVARVPDKAVAAIPEPTTARSATLGDDGLTLSTHGEETVLDRERPAVLVLFRPQVPAPPDAPPPHVDAFWFTEGLCRWRLSTRTTDLEGTGAAKGSSRTAALLRYVGECEERMSRVTVDRRSDNMRLRHRWRRGPVPAGAPQRKGYSYASPGLDALLADIEPGLEEIGQAELTARLAFLTWGARL